MGAGKDEEILQGKMRNGNTLTEISYGRVFFFDPGLFFQTPHLKAEGCLSHS